MVITGCLAVEEDEAGEEIFELNEIGHKEGLESINLGPNLTKEYQEELAKLVDEFNNLFTPDPWMTDVIQHQIKLKSEVPVTSKPYRVPYATRQDLKKDIQEMIDLRIMTESDSPHASPIVIVKKPDGPNTLCVDYMKLNKIIVFDPEPMPTAEELFHKISDDNFFSKVDLSNGYWQIKVSEEGIAKTAFVTPDGHWEFRRMPFGMVNSGSTLKLGVNRIIGDVDSALLYWGDILVHSKSWGDHMKTLRSLFQRLRHVRFTIRLSKCILGTNTCNVDFIGHRLSGGVKGLHEDNVKSVKLSVLQ